MLLRKRSMIIILSVGIQSKKKYRYDDTCHSDKCTFSKD